MTNSFLRADKRTEVLPANYYKAKLIRSGYKATRSGTGNFLELVYQITEGEFSGRVFIQRLNVLNLRHSVQNRALQELATICFATGAGSEAIINPEVLHDIEVMVNVRVKAANGTYAASNEVRGVHRVEPRTDIDLNTFKQQCFEQFIMLLNDNGITNTGNGGLKNTKIA